MMHARVDDTAVTATKALHFANWRSAKNTIVTEAKITFGNNLSSDEIFLPHTTCHKKNVSLCPTERKNTNVQTILLVSSGKRDTPPMYQMKFKFVPKLN